MSLLLVIRLFQFKFQALRNLIEMGFSEADVIDALRVANNKENDAVSIYTFETSIVWFIYCLNHKQTLLQFNK